MQISVSSQEWGTSNLVASTVEEGVVDRSGLDEMNAPNASAVRA